MVQDELERVAADAVSNAEPELPPIVLRMVIEVRSDGTRTIARGAIEDQRAGERVQIKIDNFSPLVLGREITRALLSVPSIAKRAARTMLLPRGRRSGDSK